MTSFLTLLKRDLRLQVPFMVIYSAAMLFVAIVFTFLAMRYSYEFFGAILFIFLAQFFFAFIALPINSIWREWRMKTAGHWLMLPTSVHAKIWSKILSIIIWILFLIVLTLLLWAGTGLIDHTEIHEMTFILLSKLASVDLLIIGPFMVYSLISVSIPVFLGVIMLNGEGGLKGFMYTGLLLAFYLILIPWISSIELLSSLKFGPIFLDISFFQENTTFGDSSFTFNIIADGSAPFTYVSTLILEVLLVCFMYWICWWYLARKVEI